MSFTNLSFSLGFICVSCKQIFSCNWMYTDKDLWTRRIGLCTHCYIPTENELLFLLQELNISDALSKNIIIPYTDEVFSYSEYELSRKYNIHWIETIIIEMNNLYTTLVTDISNRYKRDCEDVLECIQVIPHYVKCRDELMKFKHEFEDKQSYSRAKWVFVLTVIAFCMLLFL